MKGLPLLDRLLSIFGITLLVAFCVPLVWALNRLDLTLVIALVLLMAAYDFFDETQRRVKERPVAVDPHEQKDQI